MENMQPPKTKPHWSAGPCEASSSDALEAQPMIPDNTTPVYSEQPPECDLFGNPVASSPLGFNKRRISPTNHPSLIQQRETTLDYRDAERWQILYLQEYERSQGYDVGVSLSLYPSGEFSAACTALGAKGTPNRQPRGPNSSMTFSPTARNLLRRGIENHWRKFDRWAVFTIDPSLKPAFASLAEEHAYYHRQISRTLEAITLHHRRLAERRGNRDFSLSYVCFAEIQPDTGNLHYHVLLDRFVDIHRLVRLWGQASNSVELKKINGIAGMKYMFSYLKKGGHLIYGKRYSMSSNLYGQLKPCKVSIVGRHARTVFLRYVQLNAPTLLRGSGHIGDWGFCIRAPSRTGVTSHVYNSFVVGLGEELAENGYPQFLETILQMKGTRDGY